MGLTRRSMFVVALLLLMGATAGWRLVHPPLSPREESWLASGYRQINIGRYGNAYVRFRKVLSINAFNEEARAMMDILNIYGYLLRKNPSSGTLARYEKARQRHPGSPYVYMIGGELKLASGDPEGAIRLHLDASEIKPDLLHNWYGLGMAYRAAGQQDAALDALKLAAAGKGNSLYDLELGHQLFHVQDFEAASRAFRRAYEKSPRLVDGQIGELRSLLHAGHYDEAAQAGEALLVRLGGRSSRLARRAPRVGLALDSEKFELVSGLSQEVLKDYAARLQRWAQDLASGTPTDMSLADLPDQSPLLSVLRLDVSLLP